MAIVLIVWPVLSLCVLAAHFFRSGRLLFVCSILAVAVLLLLLRRWWTARLAQVVLLGGAFVWLQVLLTLRAIRIAEGLPATRLTLILAAVTAVTAASALVFETPPLRRLYGLTWSRSSR